MWAVAVVAMAPLWEMRNAFPRMAISSAIGPFAQGGLDEALGFAIGARGVELGEDVPQAPAVTHCNEGQGAKHFGVVGHDAANAYAEVAVVTRGMVKKRRRTTLALVGEHFGESHPRTIVDRHECRFPAGTSDVGLRMASDAVS